MQLAQKISCRKCFNNFVSVETEPCWIFCSTSFQNFRRERLKVCKRQRSHWKRKIKNFWKGFVLWRTNRLLFNSRNFHLNIDIFNKEGALFCYCGPRNTDFFRTVPSKNIYIYFCAAYDYAGNADLNRQGLLESKKKISGNHAFSDN